MFITFTRTLLHRQVNYIVNSFHARMVWLGSSFRKINFTVIFLKRFRNGKVCKFTDFMIEIF